MLEPFLAERFHQQILVDLRIIGLAFDVLARLANIALRLLSLLHLRWVIEVFRVAKGGGLGASEAVTKVKAVAGAFHGLGGVVREESSPLAAVLLRVVRLSL